MKVNAYVKIHGKVQGVWFRAGTKQKAEQLGLTGWVRNTDDGCVEAVFEGEEKQVKEFKVEITEMDSSGIEQWTCYKEENTSYFNN